MLSLGSWFRRHRTPVLGIDIGPGGIRVMELVRERKGFRVAHFAQELLPPGAMRDGGFAQIDALTESLHRALKNSGTRLRTAAMALPSGAVIKKMLMLPASLYEEELEMQVEAEASQALPFPLDEISLDFAVVGPSANNDGYVDVMLVAARKERIDERLTLAEAAGLRPLVIDLESQAMTAALTRVESQNRLDWNQPVALLQLGSEGSHCAVMLHDLVIFERGLGLSLPRTDQEKSRASAESLREVLCQELMRALQLFATSTPYAGVGHIYIAGSAQLMGADLAAFVQRRVGVEVSLPDPLADMHLPFNANQLNEDSPAWLIACGLALRSFTT